MLYIRLSCEVLTDAKILQVGPEAAFVWTRGLLYAKQHLTDGLIPRNALPLLTLGAATDSDGIAAKLVDAGLWQAVDGGWHVGQARWARHQVTRDEVENIRRKRQRPPEISSYRERLRDPRWQRTRLAIFQRDDWRCQICNTSDKPLQVHHTYYVRGCDPWDYPHESLQTLCEKCHADVSADAFEADVVRRLGRDTAQ